ncbi:MAG: hypothetical protein ACRC37_07080, partial [Lentisphaeria bacterium]
MYPAGAPISDKDQLTFALPFTTFVVLPIVIFLEVPQFAVVMLAEPLKFVPFIVLVVVSVAAEVAVVAFPDKAPEKLVAVITPLEEIDATLPLVPAPCLNIHPRVL